MFTHTLTNGATVGGPMPTATSEAKSWMWAG